MPRSACHLRPLGTALLAVAGLVCLVGPASASCGTSDTAKARPCCRTQARLACCCDPTPTPAAARPVPARPSATTAGVATPDCGCRSVPPGSPAKPAQPVTQARPHDRATGTPDSVADAPRPAAVLAVSASGLPDSVPRLLYLRNARLLI